MTRLILCMFLIVTANAYAIGIAPRECQSQQVTWDSDGKSPYEDHAKCVGTLVRTPSGSSQLVQALTTSDAGGVGFAQFQCNDGVWTIGNSHFGDGTDAGGYCAD